MIGPCRSVRLRGSTRSRRAYSGRVSHSNLIKLAVPIAPPPPLFGIIHAPLSATMVLERLRLLSLSLSLSVSRSLSSRSSLLVTPLFFHGPSYEALGQQWLQRHPEAGSSWPSWPKASYVSLGLDEIEHHALQRPVQLLGCVHQHLHTGVL